MAAQSDLKTAVIECNRLLWRTRGRHWDYTFLLRPRLKIVADWYGFHKQVFGGLTPESAEQYRVGVLRTGGQHWAASAFTDPNRRDASARPISHYFVWFSPDAPSETDSASVPGGWGTQALGVLGAALDATFDVLPYGSEEATSINSVEQISAAAISALPDTIVVSGAMVRATTIPALDLGRNVQRISMPPLSSPQNRSYADSLDPRKLEQAIIEGEAHALGFCGLTPGIFLSKRGSQELLDRLAGSFGGAASDQFVRTRIEGIQWRVARSELPQKPRRGFDALVDVLRLREDLMVRLLSSDEEGERRIAEILHADPGDRVVRSLLARLRAVVKEE